MDHENSIRKRVQALKSFYTNLVIYAVVCVACIIIWVSMGGGPFWPIWVIFGYGLSAVLQGVTLGQIPQLHEFLPFLNPEWEEEQIKKMSKKTKKADVVSPVEKHSEVISESSHAAKPNKKKTTKR
jgi:hypothetical protein